MILMNLYKAKQPLVASTLGNRLRVSPHELLKSLRFLNQAGLTDVNGPLISVTTLGRVTLQKLGRLNADEQTKSWRRIPEEFVAPGVAVNQPVTPFIWGLDRRLLPIPIENAFPLNLTNDTQTRGVRDG